MFICSHACFSVGTTAALLQWSMTNLLGHISMQLAEQLHHTFTLSGEPSNSTCVFKWLKTADSLQLDHLRTACIDALGTYLLPSVHQHLTSNKDAISALSPSTSFQVMVAIARCSNCIAWAKNIAVCPSNCIRRTHPSYNIQPPRQETRSRTATTCGVCAFRPGLPAPAGNCVAKVCNCCSLIRAWA